MIPVWTFRSIGTGYTNTEVTIFLMRCIYTYTRPPDPSGSQGYYWTALSFYTGRTVWRRYAGSGLPYNNNYAGLAIGPNRSLYLGTTGGMISLRDG